MAVTYYDDGSFCVMHKLGCDRQWYYLVGRPIGIIKPNHQDSNYSETEYKVALLKPVGGDLRLVEPKSVILDFTVSTQHRNNLLSRAAIQKMNEILGSLALGFAFENENRSYFQEPLPDALAKLL